jgi:hypothetical protein
MDKVGKSTNKLYICGNPGISDELSMGMKK